MSLRYQGGFLSSFYNPLEVPDPPTGASASAGNAQADVSFTAPSEIGGSAITGYGVISSPGDFTATGSTSPITVTGLTNGTAYTFKVWAANSYGPSAYSDQTGSVTPLNQGQQAYTTAGTYSWVAPSEVTSVSVVAVGGGGGNNYVGGGGGGGLGYKNNISVTPGCSYTVQVGAAGLGYVCNPSGTNGGDSYFILSSTVKGGGGIKGSSTNGGSGGTYIGDGGGNGGGGGVGGCYFGGGGGAGGYSGSGGYGGSGSFTVLSGGSGAGGGAGGGGSDAGSGNTSGGGVGILGQGANGAGGAPGYPGTGGSGGQNGQPSKGGDYGGGTQYPRNGGSGAVRIIWPGSSRSFPSTCTGDL